MERIGRVVDAYRQLDQEILGIVVSPEAHAELRALLRVRRTPDFVVVPVRGSVLILDQGFAGLRINGKEFPLLIDRKAAGPDAVRFETRLGRTTREMAIARAMVNRSQAPGHTH